MAINFNFSQKIKIFLFLIGILLVMGCQAPLKKNDVLKLDNLLPNIASKHFSNVPPNKRLVIGYFTYQKKQLNELGEYLAKSIPYHIKKITPKVHIYSRRKMKEAVDELKLQQSDLFDVKTTIKLGLFAGAEWILSGDITRVGDFYHLSTVLYSVKTLEEFNHGSFYFSVEDSNFLSLIEKDLLFNEDLAMPINDLAIYGTDYKNRILKGEFWLERGRYQRAVYEYNAAVYLSENDSLGYLGRAATRIAQIRELLRENNMLLPLTKKMSINKYLSDIKSDFYKAKSIVENKKHLESKKIILGYLKKLLKINQEVMGLLRNRYQ